MKHELFLDMDGVVVDLDALFVKLYGKTLRQMPKEERHAAWVNDFKPEWFLEAPPMQDMDKLLKWATTRFTSVRFLTALPNRRRDKALDSMHAKMEWVHKHVGHTIPVTFGPFAHDKQKHCAGFNYILIDDNEQNIRQWGLKGGIAVFHHNADRSIEEVERFLK